MSILKRCPCGKIPCKLMVQPTANKIEQTYMVCGDCCEKWHIEFALDIQSFTFEECKEIAEKAWNEGPRNESEKPCSLCGSKETYYVPVKEIGKVNHICRACESVFEVLDLKTFQQNVQKNK